MLVGLLATTIVPVRAAESTTGILTGTVLSAVGTPIAGARVVAAAPSGRYETTTDARGRFSLLGVTPDTYALSVEHRDYQSAVRPENTVLPGETTVVAFRLASTLHTIGQVRAVTSAFGVGMPADTFTVSGTRRAGARADDVQRGARELHRRDRAGRDRRRARHRPRPVRERDPARRKDQRRGVRLRLRADAAGTDRRARRERHRRAAAHDRHRVDDRHARPATQARERQRARGRRRTRSPPIGTYPAPHDARARRRHRRGSSTSPTFETARRDAGSALALRAREHGRRTRSSRTATAVVLSQRSGDVRARAAGPRPVLDREQRALSRTPKDDLSVLALVGQANVRSVRLPVSGRDRRRVRRTDANGNVVPYPGIANQNAAVTFASRDSRDVRHPQSRVVAYRARTRSRACSSTSRSTRRGRRPVLGRERLSGRRRSRSSQRQGGRETGLDYDGDGRLRRAPSALRRASTGSTRRSSIRSSRPPTNSSPRVRRSTRTSPTSATRGASTNRLELMGSARRRDAHFKPSDGSAYDVGALDPHAGVTYRLGDR